MKTKSKNIQSGVGKQNVQAPSKKGAWIDVQKRTIATARTSKKK